MAIKKVLIVDDEADFTAMVKLNLEATGAYQVLVENNSSAAFFAALEYRPDIILLDIIMPEPEGPDVLFQLRNDPQLKSIPVIFLTATVRRKETKEGPPSNDYVFLAKPCTLRELIATIEAQIQSRF